MKHRILLLVALTLTVTFMFASAAAAAESTIQVTFNGQPLSFDVPPQIIQDRVMLPLRAIFETMGATVTWDDATQTATAVKDDTTVIVTVNNNQVSVNGEIKTLDVAPTIVDGRTMAPLRFVAEAFGYDVTWDDATQTAHILSRSSDEHTALGDVNVGETVYFGSYEQDNNLANGNEPIAWRVLAVENGKALLISDQGLDCKKYDQSGASAITWESSGLRTWLNDDFYRAAFSSSERSQIVLSTLPNMPNVDGNGSSDTQDKVFCLSIDEAYRLFESNSARIMKATPYALEHGALASTNPTFLGNGHWWLRTPGDGVTDAAYVGYDGVIEGNGSHFDGNAGLAVRPAIWVNLEGPAAEEDVDEPGLEEDADTTTGLANVRVGETVSFGSYEQDNNMTNGKEPIAWRVLAVENGKALLISDQGLASKKFDQSGTAPVTWENCGLRTWLNGDFFQAAFSSSEQSQIALSTLDNMPNVDGNGGNDTQDKVFCLSIDEAHLLFDSDTERIMQATAYAIDQGALASSKTDYLGNGLWWLRSPGDGVTDAAYVSVDGVIKDSGSHFDGNTGIAVRPAIWVNL